MVSNSILQSDYMYIWHTESDEAPPGGIMAHIHHQFNEILYVVSGDLEYFTEGHKFIPAPESLVLIPANTYHGCRICSSLLYRRVSIHFMPGLLKPAEREPLLEPFAGGARYFPDVSSRNIGLFIRSLLECGKMEQPLQNLSLVNRLVCLLTELCLLRPAHTISRPTVDIRIQRVLKYLGEHLREDIPLDNLAEQFRISKNRLNIHFRRVMGTTVGQYLRAKRLALAQEAMLNGAGAEEAAYAAGFGDYSVFFRAYRAAYGYNPSAEAPIPPAEDSVR
jgi:AraC-like DNA-binding protein